MPPGTAVRDRWAMLAGSGDGGKCTTVNCFRSVGGRRSIFFKVVSDEIARNFTEHETYRDRADNDGTIGQNLGEEVTSFVKQFLYPCPAACLDPSWVSWLRCVNGLQKRRHNIPVKPENLGPCVGRPAFPKAGLE
jgi:hypothetical protein